MITVNKRPFSVLNDFGFQNPIKIVIKRKNYTQRFSISSKSIKKVVEINMHMYNTLKKQELLRT